MIDPGPDEVLDALDALVEAVNLTAAHIDEVASRARAVHLERASGATYAEILGGSDPRALQVVTAMLTELLDASSRLRRAEVSALYEEGLSMDNIAQLIRVSRQRVSALLRPRPSVVRRPRSGERNARPTGES